MLRRLFVRLGPYAASVLVTFAVGVLSVPALIHQVGAGAWAGLAVVQSIAALTTVLVSFGWGATGPNLIAGLATEERRQALMRSAYARIALYALALPIASVIGVAISGLPASVAILATVGYSLQALGVVWFFVGEAKPMRVFLLDAVPRAAGVVFGLVAVWITHSLLAFAASITVAALVSLFLSYRVSLRGAGPAPKPTLSLVWSELVAQRHGVVTTTMASLYYNSALIVVSVISPASLEPFALVFKLYNYAGAALVPVLQFAQGWLPSGGPGLLPRRVRVATRTALLASVGLAFVATLLIPTMGAVLSVGAVEIPWSLAIPFGVCIGAMLVNQIVGQAGLVAIGSASTLALTTSVGAIAGVALQAVGALAFGGPGVALALAIVDVGVAGWQFGVVRHWQTRIAPS